MDKLISALLSTPFGRSLIGWTCAAFFAIAAAVGAAYLSLLNDYKQDMKDGKDREVKVWEDRVRDLKELHARQDSIAEKIANKKRSK